MITRRTLLASVLAAAAVAPFARGNEALQDSPGRVAYHPSDAAAVIRSGKPLPGRDPTRLARRGAVRDHSHRCVAHRGHPARPRPDQNLGRRCGQLAPRGRALSEPARLSRRPPASRRTSRRTAPVGSGCWQPWAENARTNGRPGGQVLEFARRRLESDAEAGARPRLMHPCVGRLRRTAPRRPSRAFGGECEEAPLAERVSVGERGEIPLAGKGVGDGCGPAALDCLDGMSLNQ